MAKSGIAVFLPAALLQRLLRGTAVLPLTLLLLPQLLLSTGQ